MIAATLVGMANHPAPPLAVEESDLEILRALVRARTTEQRLAQRARIVLRAAEGRPNRQIADEVGVAPMTVLLWRDRYARAGLAGLTDEPRPGRPPIYSREDRDRVIALTLESPADGTTHWSARRLGQRLGMSETTVWRIWQTVGLKPHRIETFKFSTDPALEAKVRDVVGLYLHPPERAIVLSVDEKTQIQALDRTQPMLPLRSGGVARRSHDYKRNGTTSLFAALNVATGEVTQEARARHTGDDFLAFLRRLDRVYRDRDLHVILDNVSSHKTPDVNAWLGRHPRITFHFTPTSASWLNQVETWFSVLTRQAIRRGTFSSVKQLIATIDTFTRSWNAGSTPFAWVKSADEILAKAVRKRPATSESGH